MLDKALISQLQSMNVTQRKEAIMALGRTKDREAIPHLSRVAESDPDDELRDLARKAAIFIDKNAPIVNVKPFKMPWDDEEEEDEADAQPMSAAAAAALNEYAPPSPEEITERQDQEWAERFIERAWQAHYTKDREGAEMYLRKAFERSPDIAENANAREAAGKIMNMNPDRAVSALLKPKTMRRGAKPDTASHKVITSSHKVITSSHKVVASTPPPAVVREEKTADEIEDGSATTLLADLFLFLLIVVIFEALSLVAGGRIMLDALTTPGAPVDPISIAMRDIFANVTVLGAIGIVLYSLFSAVQWLIIFLVVSFLTHIVASNLMDGHSTFARLVRKTYWIYAIWWSAGTTLLVVAAYIGFIPSANIGLWQGLAGITWLLSTFITAWRIGVAYRIDFARGCFTIILTGVASVCCSVTIGLGLIVAGVGPFAAFQDLLFRR